MGPPESPTGPRKRQAAGRRKRRARRPRQRKCLVKGCEQRFHPRQAGQRYCSENCRKKAREWARWKAQQKYRSTAGGKQKRNGQSRLYRQRLKSRQAPETEPVNEDARVITPEHFFRAYVRPAGLLRGFRAAAAKSVAALLLRIVPACCGTRAAAGAALEAGTHLSRTY